MNIELLPHKGVIIEDEFIGFGTDIRNLNKKYKMKTYGNMHYLFDSNLQIETADNMICMIDCCVAYDSLIVPSINGHSLFRVETDQVIEMLNEILNETGVSTEQGYSYMWFGSDVSCWREMKVEDAEEMVREAKEDGTYEEMKVDIERDILRSRYFETIGIGKAGYYS